MQQLKLEQKSSHLIPVSGGIAALHNTLLTLCNRIAEMEKELRSMRNKQKTKILHKNRTRL